MIDWRTATRNDERPSDIRLTKANLRETMAGPCALFHLEPKSKDVRP